MDIKTDVKENLETQMFELEALQSVFPKEISVFDHGNLADINNFTSGIQIKVPHRLEYEVEISTQKVSLVKKIIF